MKLYVNAASKKALNERLAAGAPVSGVNHAAHFDGGESCYCLDERLPTGTTIAIYDKLSGGSPVAKSWGIWNGIKKRVE